MKHTLLIFLLAAGLAGRAQSPQEQFTADTTTVNELLAESKKYINSEAVRAIELATQARAIASRSGFTKGEALAHKAIGLVYYFQGKWAPTLEHWTQSLKMLEELKDDNGVSNLLSNIGAVYTIQGDDARGLEYHLKALALAEKTGDKLRTLSALNNVGSVYFNKRVTWDKAEEYLTRAFKLAEEQQNAQYVGIAAENLGEIYNEKQDFEKALYYYNRSLKALGDSENSPFAYNGIGKVYRKKGDHRRALAFHEKAYDIARKLNATQVVQSLRGVAAAHNGLNDHPTADAFFEQAVRFGEEQKAYPDLKELYEDMAKNYAERQDYANAYKYRSRLDAVKDTLYNEATRKKLGLITMEFDLQKKESQISLLTKDKQLREEQLKKENIIKNVFAAGLVMLFLIAFIIYRNYRQKVRINKVLDRQKDEIENLLLNILPAEVAKELQERGTATPRNYEQVSVLFTDFKGFTSIADKMSPQELVAQLNACFVAFDEIIGRHNLEKIKTIGDAYMCAGGIPTPDSDHHYRIVAAGLEIQEYMLRNNQRRREQGMEPWDVRIGIHCGPLVAGVVGKKKYAYDIWGSTVNIASRMESNGAPGLVNISAAAYDRVKDRYACSYRGKVHAKNVGDIDMYFVDHGYQVPGRAAAELQQEAPEPHPASAAN